MRFFYYKKSTISVLFLFAETRQHLYFVKPRYTRYRKGLQSQAAIMLMKAKTRMVLRYLFQRQHINIHMFVTHLMQVTDSILQAAQTNTALL